MQDDIEILLSKSPGDPGRPITPNQLRYMHRDIRSGLKKAMAKLAADLKSELVYKYQLAIRTVERDSENSLRKKMEKAMIWEVGMDPGEIWMGVFDLAAMEDAWQQDRGGNNRGWFNLFEDGRVQPGHGSDTHTFVTLAEAIDLANDCAEEFHLNEEKRDDLIRYVQEVFAGRHGEGIMVANDKPLFFKYPTFGSPDLHQRTTAGELLHKRGHPGFMAWNVISGMRRSIPQGGFLQSFVEKVVADVLEGRYAGQ